MLNTIPNFLVKLRRLLEDESTNHAISWDESGASFHIYDMNMLSKAYLPNYFKHNNYASFVRQLNMYGFRKVNRFDGSTVCTSKMMDDIEFQHPYFTRDDPSLMTYMQRRPTLSNPISQPQNNLFSTTLNSFDSNQLYLNPSQNLKLALLPGTNGEIPNGTVAGTSTENRMVFSDLYDIVRRMYRRHKDTEFRVEQLERECIERKLQVDSLRNNLQKHTLFTKQLINILLTTNPDFVKIFQNRQISNAIDTFVNELDGNGNSNSINGTSNLLLALTDGGDSSSIAPLSLSPRKSLKRSSVGFNSFQSPKTSRLINQSNYSVSSPGGGYISGPILNEFDSTNSKIVDDESTPPLSLSPSMEMLSQSISNLSRVASLSELEIDDLLKNFSDQDAIDEQCNFGSLNNSDVELNPDNDFDNYSDFLINNYVEDNDVLKSPNNFESKFLKSAIKSNEIIPRDPVQQSNTKIASKILPTLSNINANDSKDIQSQSVNKPSPQQINKIRPQVIRVVPKNSSLLSNNNNSKLSNSKIYILRQPDSTRDLGNAPGSRINVNNNEKTLTPRLENNLNETLSKKRALENRNLNESNNGYANKNLNMFPYSPNPSLHTPLNFFQEGTDLLDCKLNGPDSVSGQKDSFDDLNSIFLTQDSFNDDLLL